MDEEALAKKRRTYIVPVRSPWLCRGLNVYRNESGCVFFFPDRSRTLVLQGSNTSWDQRGSCPSASSVPAIPRDAHPPLYNYSPSFKCLNTGLPSSRLHMGRFAQRVSRHHNLLGQQCRGEHLSGYEQSECYIIVYYM